MMISNQNRQRTAKLRCFVETVLGRFGPVWRSTTVAVAGRHAKDLQVQPSDRHLLL